MKKEKPKNWKFVLYLLSSIGAILLLTTIIGSSVGERDYQSCINAFKPAAYRGRTGETQQQVQLKDDKRMEEQKEICTTIYKSQSPIGYLFDKSYRNTQIKRYCDTKAQKQQLSTIQANNNPLYQTIFGEIGFDYNQFYNQCTTELGS